MLQLFRVEGNIVGFCGSGSVFVVIPKIVADGKMLVSAPQLKKSMYRS